MQRNEGEQGCKNLGKMFIRNEIKNPLGISNSSGLPVPKVKVKELQYFFKYTRGGELYT